MNNTDQMIDELLENDSLEFSEEQLNIEDYELKILILSSILAENNLAYRGTLTKMCEWLGVKQNTNNNKNIKNAILSLQEKGYIFYKLDGRTQTITISEKGMKEKQIIRIRKAQVYAFKEYNKNGENKRIDKSIAIDQIKILKVFVYLQHRDNSNLITIIDIATALKMSSTTVSNALKAIEQCSLCGIRFYKYTIKDKVKIQDD